MAAMWWTYRWVVKYELLDVVFTYKQRCEGLQFHMFVQVQDQSMPYYSRPRANTCMTCLPPAWQVCAGLAELCSAILSVSTNHRQQQKQQQQFCAVHGKAFGQCSAHGLSQLKQESISPSINAVMGSSQ